MALLGGSTASATAAGRSAPGHWSRPFTLAGPYAEDIAPPQLAFGPGGEAAVGFALFNPDFPGHSEALISTRAPNGKLARPRKVPKAQEVLALAYDGSALELLIGSSPARFTCCSRARAVTFGGGKFTNQRTLVSNVNGAALGALVPLRGTRMLAAVASGAGVWVAASPAVGRFGAARKLTSSISSAQSLSATALSKDGSAVAWTEPAGALANVPAVSIFLATGSAKAAPRGRRLAATAPPGHAIDELDLTGGSAGPTAAWIESWYDSAGAYHAEAALADLVSRPRARRFEVPGQVASGLALAADAKGDQVLTWKTCDELGVCSVRAVSRAAGRRSGAPQRLGAIDTGEEPAVTVGPNGQALVGWVSGGHVLVAERGSAGGRFGRAATISSVPPAYDLTLAFGPSGQALAVWTQGTAAPRLLAAFHG
jgi:hypothetical protein